MKNDKKSKVLPHLGGSSILSCKRTLIRAAGEKLYPHGSNSHQIITWTRIETAADKCKNAS
jgi:hypothetical protein